MRSKARRIALSPPALVRVSAEHSPGARGLLRARQRLRRLLGLVLGFPVGQGGWRPVVGDLDRRDRKPGKSEGRRRGSISRASSCCRKQLTCWGNACFNVSRVALSQGLAPTSRGDAAMTKPRWNMVSKTTLAMVIAAVPACQGGVAEKPGGGSEVEATAQALTTVDVDRCWASRQPRFRTGRSFRAAQARSAFRPRHLKDPARWRSRRTGTCLCRAWL